MTAATQPPALSAEGNPIEKCAGGVRLAQDPYCDFGDDSEQALRAHEQTEQIVVSAVEILTPEPHDLPFGRDELDAQNVVRGESVLEAMHAARVLRDIATDRAGDLARRIRSVVEAAVGDGLRQGEVTHAGLRDDTAIVEVDVEDAVELSHPDDDGIDSGNRASGERGSRAARHDLESFAMCVAQNGRHFLGGSRQDDRKGPGAICRPTVRFVGREARSFLDDALGRQKCVQGLQNLRAPFEDRLIRFGETDHRSANARAFSLSCVALRPGLRCGSARARRPPAPTGSPAVATR